MIVLALKRAAYVQSLASKQSFSVVSGLVRMRFLDRLVLNGHQLAAVMLGLVWSTNIHWDFMHTLLFPLRLTLVLQVAVFYTLSASQAESNGRWRFQPQC
jgi:hypothetical protein